MMQKRNRITDIFPMLLFLIFTLSALGIVTFSVQIYRNIVERAEGRFDTETAAAYISEKFRNHDLAGRIGISNFEGNAALTIDETVKEVPYITYIYVYDGYLRELFIEKEKVTESTAADGNEILPMKEMKPEQLSDRLVRIEFTDADGRKEETYLSLKSGGSPAYGAVLPGGEEAGAGGEL